MKRLLTYYGDDFTGSTDVMEALSLHGIKTVLFTRPPEEQEFASFAGYDAIGLAGTSRSQTTQWMDQNLPDAFRWLKSLDARFCHYKVCSTFDSAPHVGNIGKAIEIGRAVFEQDIVPLVVGVPQLKRYTAFGHLFAGYQGQICRIDRHPVMSRHPVTPMDEADLRLHLAKQTALPVKLVPASFLDDNDRDARIGAILRDLEGIVLLDVYDAATQAEAGRQLLRINPSIGPFLAGSSGVEYALVNALKEQGIVREKTEFATLPPVDRTIAVSGSCSPTTARQIRHALANGFRGIEADPVKLALEPERYHRVVEDAAAILQAGSSALIYTSLNGEVGKASALDAIPGGRHRVGEALGKIARETMNRCELRRAIIAGGDTSSHALGQLDVFALTVRLPLQATPGSPLCIAHSRDVALDGIEIAMKGGQVGGDDYFVMLRDGTAAP